MEDVGNGVFKVTGDEEADEVSEAVIAAMKRTSERERIRLNAENPDKPWWADAVFLLRDINGLARLFQARGEPEVAETLAEIVGRGTEGIVMNLLQGDKHAASQMLHKMVEDGQVLDAVISRELLQLQGQREQ